MVSGYVSKIDLKKKELTVHGAEVTPAAQPQKFTAASSYQAPGGGHGGGGRGQVAGAAEPGAEAEPLKRRPGISASMSVTETVIQTDKGSADAE